MNTSFADPNKVKRYTRLAVINGFLLALLWPVGGYFFWIFGGLITYFLFLVWFYSPRQQSQPKQNWSRSTYTTQQARAESLATDVQKKVKWFFIVFGGLIVFFFVFLMIVGLIWGEPEPVETTTENYPAEDFDPTNLDDLTNRGNQFYDQQQYDSAMKYYEAVLAIEPENQSALYNKALVYYTRQDYSLSIRLLRKCLKLYPDYGYAYYLLGDDYKAVGKGDTALICFEKAYEYEIRDSELLQNLGESYARIGKRQDALRIYQEAISRDSSLIEVYKRLVDLDPQNAAAYQREIQKRSN